jgi:hypothetical protein
MKKLIFSTITAALLLGATSCEKGIFNVMIPLLTPTW